MDLDTLIYIIATIIIFVVSLLGQNKNKKNKNIPVESEPDKVVYSLNDFEKILQRKEEFRQAHEMKQEKTEMEERVALTEMEEPEHIIEHTSPIIEKKKEVKKEENIEEKEDGFDLNSAIIYSSILERKKFRH